MVRLNAEDLTPAQLAVLALLKAPDAKGRDGASIPGRIHLAKELFAIQTTPLGKRLLPELEFEADNYGPFDEVVFAALDTLQDAGLVEFETSDVASRIKLTARGRQFVDEVWRRMKEEVRTLLGYVKSTYNDLSSTELLHKIYAAYPELADNSISPVAQKYRRVRTK